MSNSQWHDDQALGERALRDAKTLDERDRAMGRAIRQALGEDAAFLASLPDPGGFVRLSEEDWTRVEGIGDRVFVAVRKALREAGRGAAP